MSRARKGCVHCDVNHKDWTWSAIPVDMGVLGDFFLNVWVRGYKKQLFVELEPEKSEPIWDANIGIEYCPFCGTKLDALVREERMRDE